MWSDAGARVNVVIEVSSGTRGVWLARTHALTQTAVPCPALVPTLSSGSLVSTGALAEVRLVHLVSIAVLTGHMTPTLTLLMLLHLDTGTHHLLHTWAHTGRGQADPHLLSGHLAGDTGEVGGVSAGAGAAGHLCMGADDQLVTRWEVSQVLWCQGYYDWPGLA